MKSKILSLTILLFGIGVAVITLSGGDIFAQNENSGFSKISYPVAELGNCADRDSCKDYCNKPGNMDTCLAFAEKNKLMDEREIQVAKKFRQGKMGPGGCNSRDSCEAFCDDISHINECVAFAEENNLIDERELQEVKKVKAAMDRGIKPPPCGNKKQCDLYCMKPDNIEQCIAFAQEAGLMDEEEKEESQKVLVAIKKGVKPPACGGKKQCDEYCGKEEHFEECISFAEAAGFMSPKEAQMVRKTGGKGPGGCRGREECDKFCSNPQNEEICFNFGMEKGLIPEEDLRKMEEGRKQMADGLKNAPPEVVSCIKDAVGEEKLEKIKSGTGMPSRQLGDAMRKCFESFMGSFKGGDRGLMRDDDPSREGPKVGDFNNEDGRGPKEGMGGFRDNLERVIKGLPSEIKECAAPSLSSEVLENNNNPREFIEGVIRRCYEKSFNINPSQGVFSREDVFKEDIGRDGGEGEKRQGPRGLLEKPFGEGMSPRPNTPRNFPSNNFPGDLRGLNAPGESNRAGENSGASIRQEEFRQAPSPAVPFPSGQPGMEQPKIEPQPFPSPQPVSEPARSSSWVRQGTILGIFVELIEPLLRLK